MDKKYVGQLGEDIGVQYLKKKGYKILDRNFTLKIDSLKVGEIDIVAKKDSTVTFVEVKTRARADNITPEEKVNFWKTKKIINTAQVWLERHNIPPDFPWQIDILAINLNFQTRKAKVKHFQNV